jgi:hypothetical protein
MMMMLFKLTTDDGVRLIETHHGDGSRLIETQTRFSQRWRFQVSKIEGQRVNVWVLYVIRRHARETAVMNV